MLLLCSDRQLTIQETKYNNKIPRTPSELFSKYPKNLNIARGKKFNNPLSCMNNYNFPFQASPLHIKPKTHALKELGHCTICPAGFQNVFPPLYHKVIPLTSGYLRGTLRKHFRFDFLANFAISKCTWCFSHCYCSTQVQIQIQRAFQFL